MREEYTTKDSGLMFILVLIVPMFFALVLSSILNIVFPNMSETASAYVGLALNQIGFFLTFVVYNHVTKVQTRQASKINFKLNVWQILIVIALGLVAMYGFSPLVNYMDWTLRSIGFKLDSFSALNFDNVGMLFVNIFLVALLPALCEELVFRGVVMNGLKKFKPAVMMILSGLLFAIMHLNIEQSVYQFVLGMVLSGVVMISGSIVSSMILHFFNNAIVLISNYFMPQSSESILWAPTSTWDHIEPFVYAIISLAIIFGLFILLRKCTKNPQSDLFNFKKQSKPNSTANINNINDNKASTDKDVEINDSAVASEGETIKTKPLVSTDDFFLWGSVAFGVLLWVITILGQL